MADSVLSLLDLMKMNASDRTAGIIDLAATNHPELSYFGRPITGTTYKTLFRTSQPEGAFRAANEGKDNQSSVYENRIVESFIFDGSWFCDKAVADGYEFGASQFVTEESEAAMRGALKSLGRQFFYGTSSGVTGAASGFQGLADVVADDYQVDAGSTTDDVCSSVFAVKFGPQDVAWAMGNSGMLDESDIKLVPKEDSDGATYTAYWQSILGWIGVQLVNVESVGRIHSIDTTANLTDADLSDLMGKMEKDPDVLFMTRRTLWGLQGSRTATTTTGRDAPVPTDYQGIPIVVTEGILNTEDDVT